jgi:HAE1 family hydrophobic/amphiphilic exporter-1
VIGGVITSSLLTLVVVPVVYCYMDDLAAWAKRRWQGGSRSTSKIERLSPFGPGKSK